MPLKCLRSGEEVHAWDFDDDELWANLRSENKKFKTLSFSCCESGVVIKTSKLGTRYFAHAVRGECRQSGETSEHLLAKSVVCSAGRKAGWIAMSEHSGMTPDGDHWRADAFLSREASKIAVEIQWSRQGRNETDFRQERLRASGVRGLWLFKQHDIPVSKSTPAFRLIFDQAKSTFEVLMPSSRYNKWLTAREAIDPVYWGQRIPLDSFIEGALQGKLRFSPAVSMEMPVEVFAVTVPCWRCHGETGIVTEMRFAASRIFPGCPDIPVSFYEMEEQLYRGVDEAISILPGDLLRKHGIGEIKPRSSKTAGLRYLSNGCVHCDALQGRFYEHEYAYGSELAFETRAVFKAGWAERLESSATSALVWWFDES